jgi:hypothetical protein
LNNNPITPFYNKTAVVLHHKNVVLRYKLIWIKISSNSTHRGQKKKKKNKKIRKNGGMKVNGEKKWGRWGRGNIKNR